MKTNKTYLKRKKPLFTTALLIIAERLEWTHPEKAPEQAHLLTEQLGALIKVGANINANYRNCKCGMRPCKDEAPPLVRVVRHLAAVKLLLTAGADLEKWNNQGETALIHALRYKDLSLLETLIKAGADINTLSWTGWAGWPRGQRMCGCTPLMCIARSSEKILDYALSVIDLLLQAGADSNKRNQEGKTALMLAVQKDFRLPLVQRLLAAGADTKARTIFGKTTLDYATPKIHSILISSLEV